MTTNALPSSTTTTRDQVTREFLAEIAAPWEVLTLDQGPRAGDHCVAVASPGIPAIVAHTWDSPEGQATAELIAAEHNTLRTRSSVETTIAAAQTAVAWLDAHRGRDHTQLLYRLLKLQEEAGEAAAAWAGVTGNNPRKGTTHAPADVAAELADVAITAFVALHSLTHLGVDPDAALTSKAAGILDRIHGGHAT